jgi:hypothetical protein
MAEANELLSVLKEKRSPVKVINPLRYQTAKLDHLIGVFQASPDFERTRLVRQRLHELQHKHPLSYT